jgi:hypothetical protein
MLRHHLQARHPLCAPHTPALALAPGQDKGGLSLLLLCLEACGRHTMHSVSDIGCEGCIMAAQQHTPGLGSNHDVLQALTLQQLCRHLGHVMLHPYRLLCVPDPVGPAVLLRGR